MRGKSKENTTTRSFAVPVASSPNSSYWYCSCAGGEVQASQGSVLKRAQHYHCRRSGSPALLHEVTGRETWAGRESVWGEVGGSINDLGRQTTWHEIQAPFQNLLQRKVQVHCALAFILKPDLLGAAPCLDTRSGELCSDALPPSGTDEFGPEPPADAFGCHVACPRTSPCPALEGAPGEGISRTPDTC